MVRTVDPSLFWSVVREREMEGGTEEGRKASSGARVVEDTARIRKEVVEERAVFHGLY